MEERAAVTPYIVEERAADAVKCFSVEDKDEISVLRARNESLGCEDEDGGAGIGSESESDSDADESFRLSAKTKSRRGLRGWRKRVEAELRMKVSTSSFINAVTGDETQTLHDVIDTTASIASYQANGEIRFEINK